MAQCAVKHRSSSIRLACRTFSISETCYRYEPKLSDENELIADWLVTLTDRKKAWGFGLCFLHLRNVKGFGWNHKRVYRIYHELELNMRPLRHCCAIPCRVTDQAAQTTATGKARAVVRTRSAQRGLVDPCPASDAWHR